MKNSFSTQTRDDSTLLPAVIAAAQSAGRQLKARFSTQPQGFEDFAGILAALHANDEISLAHLREPLLASRPGSQWAEEEYGTGELPPGEWWVTDPVEGNINLIHGMGDWCVTATLVRDNLPVLTVIHVPLSGETYSAVRGHGAWLDEIRLRVSRKTALPTAIVGTGQAAPGESRDTFRRIGQSVTAMLEAGSILRVSVPATWQLVQVAAGRTDAFWQFSSVRSGLVAGALLVEEAGGVLSDTRGRPWSFASADFLAAAPGLQASAVAVLHAID